MPLVKGSITTPGGGGFRGHHVELSFDEALSASDGQSPVWIPAVRRGALGDDGAFSLDVPESSTTHGPWRLDVRAPDGTLLHRAAYDRMPDEVRLTATPQVAIAIRPSTDPWLGRRVKVTGRVLDSSGKRHAASLQVVLWAQPVESDQARAVATARTDGRGYFSFEYPRGQFVSASGVVGVGDGITVPIPLADGGFPRQVILSISLPDSEVPAAPGDCECAPTAPRGQDPVDVVTSPESFSTDAGGRCVDFTIPNRAIEEFSFHTVVRTTEPAIQGLTLTDGRKVLHPDVLKRIADIVDSRPRAGDRRATVTATATARPLRISPDALDRLGDSADGVTAAELAIAADHTAMDEINHLLDFSRKPLPGRSPITAKNPIDWDAEPRFYQAATIAHGHLLHFKQVWRADGYSLGDLLYSLPLAPCQKKQIAVLDWERREVAERAEERVATDELTASLARDRDISEIVQSTSPRPCAARPQPPRSDCPRSSARGLASSASASPAPARARTRRARSAPARSSRSATARCRPPRRSVASARPSCRPSARARPSVPRPRSSPTTITVTRSPCSDLRPQDFPAPIVNLQNAPAAPDPLGLGAALQVIGAANAFRDVTGLAQNQQNAMASMAITQDTLRHMITTSAALAKEKNAQQNLPSAMQTLYQAMKKGVVDQETGKTLAEGFFKGAGAGTPEDRKVTDEPEVKELLKRDGMTSMTYHRPPEFLSASYVAEPEVIDHGEIGPPTDEDGNPIETNDDAVSDVVYGGYDLQPGDRDASRRWGGTKRSGDGSPPKGADYVRQLQRDLRTLGNTAVSVNGVYDSITAWSVREFQIYAGMDNIAELIPTATGATPPARYRDRLQQVVNTDVYTGPISGVVNAETRLLLQVWLAYSYRIPVVVEAWTVSGPSRTGTTPVAENLLKFNQHRVTTDRMYVTDFTGYYRTPDQHRPR